MGDKKDKLLIAAIDFGTTFSGYAFSFKHDYKMDPLKISTNQNWVAGSRGLVSLKAPTCVLLSPQKEFIAFGYEAEDLYSELALDENHYDHYFFKRFKMVLHESRKLSRTILIKDDKGKEAPALDLFAQVIRYLKNHLLSALDTKGTTVNNKDIHWVLTVPAIWTDSAKQFMREAANKAGILTEQLTICLEPEAASLYCQHLPTTKLMGNPGTQSFLSNSSGTKYMIIDLGGGTADITIHQKQCDGTLKELHRPTGGPWGGTKVDEAFHQMIIKIVGASCFQKFKDDFKADDLDIHRELETKKRTIKPESNSKITIKLPVSLVTTFEDETGEKMKEVIQQMQYANKMTWQTDKLRMEADLFKELFKEPVNMLVEHLQELMKRDNLTDISTLLMVGGFSESPMMLDAVMKSFPDKKVIVPEDAGLAVLKGAVLFGHKPQSITIRKARYTYGINISPPFVRGDHSPARKVTIDGVDRVKDVFKKYIQCDQDIRVGEAVSGRHVTIKSNQSEMLLKIFASEDPSPKYVTDNSCEYLGKVVVKLPEAKERLKVDVKMIFGETELMVEAKESTTGKVYSSYFDFL